MRLMPFSRINLQSKVSLLVVLGLAIIFAFFFYLGRQALDENTQKTLQERHLLALTIANHVDDILKQTTDQMEAFVSTHPNDLSTANTGSASILLSEHSLPDAHFYHWHVPG